MKILTNEQVERIRRTREELAKALEEEQTHPTSKVYQAANQLINALFVVWEITPEDKYDK